MIKEFAFSDTGARQLGKLGKRLGVKTEAEVVRKALMVLDYMTSGCGELQTYRNADEDIVSFREYGGSSKPLFMFTKGTDIEEREAAQKEKRGS